MDSDGRLEAGKSGNFYYKLSPITDGEHPTKWLLLMTFDSVNLI